MSNSYYSQPNKGPPLPPRGPPPPIPYHTRPTPPVPPLLGAGQYAGEGVSAPPFPNPPASSFSVTSPPTVPTTPLYGYPPSDQQITPPPVWQVPPPPQAYPPPSPPQPNLPPLPPRRIPAPPQTGYGADQNNTPQPAPSLVHEPLQSPANASNSGPILPKFCPKSEYHLRDATWYGVIPVSNAFTICGHCYHENIAHSRLSSHFAILPVSDPNMVFSCDFATSRSHRLWSHALESGDIGPFKQYVSERATAIPCAGKDGVKGSAPNAPKKWYSPSEGNIDNFIVCATCYEEEIAGTPLERSFIEYRTIKGHGAEDVWSCSLAHKFTRAAVKAAAKGEIPWNNAAQAILLRRGVPNCPGLNSVNPAGYAWWRPKREVKGMVFCSACYMDWGMICYTTPGFTNDDIERVPNEMVVATNEEASKWSCDLAVMGILFAVGQECNIPIPSQHAAYEQLWRTAVESQIAYSCAKQPEGQISTDVRSYALRSSSGPLDTRPISFDICEPCYLSYVRVLGLERFFVESNYRQMGATLTCDFSLKSTKLLKLFPKLVEAFGMDNFTIFEEYVKERLHLLPCPRDVPEPKRNWYGIGSEFLVCPECYLDIVRSSPLDHLITIRNVSEPRPTDCMLYSSRTRTHWAEACSSGSIETFLEFQKRRSAVHAQVTPRIREIRNTWKSRQELQARYIRNSHERRISSMNSSTVATMANITFHSYGSWRGPSPVSNSAMLSAQSTARQADEWMAKATNMVIATEEEIAEEKRLSAVWAEVE